MHTKKTLIIAIAAASFSIAAGRANDKFRIPVPESPNEAWTWAPGPDAPGLDTEWQKNSPYMALDMFDRMREAEASSSRGMVKLYDGLGRIYGLVVELAVYPDQWPKMRLPCAIGVGRHPAISRDAGAHTSRQTELWEKENVLGAVRIPDAQMEFGGETIDWAHNTLELTPVDANSGKEYSLSLTLSRLTPGMLIQTDSPRIDFFNGGAMPAFAAVSDGKGKANVVSLLPGLSGGTSIEDALAGGETDWMLFWFGENGNFLKHPFPFSFNRGGLHVAYAHLGDMFPADIPVLAVFSEPPYSMDTDEAVCVEFFETDGDAGETRSIVLIPLYGWRHPDVSETAAWKNGLPENVLARCEWWAKRCGKYPVSVAESYGYDKAAQAPVVTEKFEFIDVLNGAGFIAPVPPMLAMAERMGFAIEFSDSPVFDEECVTAFGPAAGIENASEYSWRAPGIAKYALEQRAPAGALPAEAAPVQALLEQEARKIAESNGLDPWLLLLDDLSRGGTGGGYFFMRTGEEASLASLALPLLPAETASALAAWLKRRIEAYPPQQHLNMPPFTGAGNRREYWLADEFVFAPENYKPEKWYAGVGYDDTIPLPSYDRIPTRELYGLWAAHAAAGSVPSKNDWNQCKSVLAQTVAGHEWAGMGWFLRAAELAGVDGFSPHRPYFQQYYGGVMAVNSYFSGLTGFIRLARMMGDAPAEEYAWGLFAKAAALRFAQGKYPAYMHKTGAFIPPVGEYGKDSKGRPLALEPDWFLKISGDGSGYLYTADWSKPEHDVRQVVAMDERGTFLFEGSSVHRHVYLVPLMHATPELGRFLKDFLKEECDAYYQRVEESFPDWHIARAESHMGGDKSYYRFPVDSWQMFLEQAWVGDAGGEQLAARLDQPWTARGDLFHLQKLVETIMAFRKAEWKAAE